MSLDDQVDVDLACKGYQNAGQCWCRRYTNLLKDDKSLPRDIDFLLKHTSHTARQLTSKRMALQTGLSFVRKTLWPQVLDRLLKAPSTRLDLLQHFLVQCLRLHDGLTLLISGECRHTGDIRTAKNKTKFPSQLPLQAHRNDGYTKLYNAPGGYSGYGWDEFHDKEVGIQTRLFRAMQRYAKKKKSFEQISEFLLERGGQVLESLWDQHEAKMNLLQQEFTALKDLVVRDLKKVAIQSGSSVKTIKVSFELHDKMEKLQLDNILLERRGDAFQVMDPQGALPSGYTTKDWARVMQLPEALMGKKKMAQKSGSHRIASSKPAAGIDTSKPNQGKDHGRKRRRVIDDSSSEDEGMPSSKTESRCEMKAKQSKPQQKVTQQTTAVTKPSMTSGLTIKIKEKPKPQTPGEGKSFSLTAIKTKMGADVKALETAREEVEKEEAGATKAAAAEEEQDEAMGNTFQQGETKIKMLQKTLKRVLNRDAPDENEIWDARECLREALMAVGNQILGGSRNQDESKNETRQQSLLKAHSYFDNAKELVKEQETFHRTLASHKKISEQEYRFYLRNLLLLRGQAHTNLGITCVELATQKMGKTGCNTAESRRYFRDAIQELEMAKNCAEALRSQAVADRRKGCGFAETALDSLKAEQLDSLSARWMGRATWGQGLRKEAAKTLERGASFFLILFESWKENSFHDDNIHDAQLQLASECFYASITLAELASEALEQLPPTSTNDTIQTGDELLSYVTRGLMKASRVSEAINSFLESNPVEQTTYEEFLEDNEIMDSMRIRQSLRELEEWWNRRKAFAKRPISVDPLVLERRPLPPTRSDVVSEAPEKMPTRRFVVGEGSSRQRNKKRNGPGPMYHRHSGNLLSSLPQPDPDDSSDNLSAKGQDQSIKYRPWGDDLLPQTIDGATGRSVPLLVYPSVAPPMPPEVRAFLEVNQL
jgi:tetratricopeptide (TPR) repeat protein